ncbi:MAG: DUF3841 domain-containing protein [Lachnospiraceae bacterium]|nr:DUF3841 domain-containing protein [Lachnospiraceae bacterium]MCM1240908.1 DUF3841 domain-containing protein [Lachnospiraceae bacterium]
MHNPFHDAQPKLKLVTFQSLEAVRDLVNKGYLECAEDHIDLKKYGYAYSWISEKMKERIKNDSSVCYPLWCWVKCHDHICPPKHKGEPVKGFDVKVTFAKAADEVFITDFIRYSFLLNHTYIPDSLADKERFDKKLAGQTQAVSEIRREIEKSFDRCITTDSDILQGCVWRISLEEIEKIEFLNDKSYRYGSLNHKRSDGKRVNWIEAFYRTLR